MFCYQCEQTDRRGELPGCASARGVCGKDAPTSDLQDALVHAVLGVAQHTAALRALGGSADADLHFCCEALFTTLTNVNFDPARIELLVREAGTRRAALAERLLALGGPSAVPATGPAAWRPAPTLDGLLAQSATLGPDAGLAEVGPTVTGLRALVLYGLKGVAAYAHHAHVIGGEDPRALAGVERAAVFLAGAPTDPAALLEEALELGRTNLAVMELLDRTNLTRFGARTPAAVPVTPVPGKAVLVSGHDFLDLEAVLEATAGTGINVYTHGELLPAHSYPALARYPHLVGNYGGAWYEQRREFAAFPGPVVMTSNCLVEPRPSYRERLFTTGPVGWPGVRHVTGRDFTDVVTAALAQPGFGPEVADAERRTVTVGFGHDVVLAQADAIVAAVRAGELNHFFLIGGCDGSSSGRDYYSSFADATPEDSAILTLGCAKFRFNGHEFGTVAGLPRLLDVGQCNDAYSAIRIATALADAFGCGVNDLPLTLAISWFEQKAVAVLLTLLALDVRNIRLGPQLPAFLTPEAVDLLVGTYGLHTNGDPAGDLAADLAGARG